jgi:CHAT domain-containing protein/tetratricopeptide (TPR) repeat protein
VIAGLSGVIVVAGLLAGCEASAPSRTVTVAESTVVVERPNLVGEPCRVQAVTVPEPQSNATRAFSVFCGRWEYPSGRLFEATVPAASPEAAAATEWWQAVVSGRATCEGGRAGTVLGDIPAFVLDCRLRNGGWAYTALTAQVGGKTYLADGVPAVRPVLEEAIGVAAGRLPARAKDTPPTVTAAIQRLEAELKGRLYGAGDLDTYYQLMLAGQYHNSVRDFSSAEARYREALTVQQRVLGVDHPETADPLMHVALELSNQGRFQEADGLFGRVESLLEGSSDRSDQARYLSYRAYHLANQGRFEEALPLAREASGIRRELASGRGPAGGVLLAGAAPREPVPSSPGSPSGADVVQSLYLEAASLQRLGQPQLADRVTQEAMVELLAAPQAPPLWEPQLRVQRAEGSSASAERDLAEAVARFEQVAPEERPTALSYLALGQRHLAAGRVEEGLAAYRSGLRLLKARGGSLRLDPLLPYFRALASRAEAQPSEHAAIHAELFEAGQLVRGSRTAHDIALASARLAASRGGTGDAIRALQDAEDERYFLTREYEAEVASGKDPLRVAALGARLVELNRRVQDLNLQVQAAAPGYNQLVDAVVSAEQVRSLLRRDEAMAQLLLGETASVLFVVRPEGISVRILDLTAAAATRAVAALRAGLAPGADGSIPQFDLVGSHRLYQALLGPAAAEVRSARHLITVPTGPLLSLPFAVLVAEAPAAGASYAEVQWLGRRSAISLVPSVRAFVDLRALARGSAAPEPFLGFGDFVPFSPAGVARADVRLSRDCLAEPGRVATYRSTLQGLGELPLTGQEVKAVARIFGAGPRSLFLNTDFTEPRVEGSKLDRYRVLYFATHALLPAEFDCQPEASLVASLSDPPQPGEDGLIDTTEVLRLNLDADLVVLSACNTGGPGGHEGGESLSGLARAFFFAGARSMLVSHWPVEDAATADLMVRLFETERSRPGLGLAESLRQAQLTLIADARRPGLEFRSHPLFWGAFTLVGDGARGVSGHRGQ